MSGSRFQGTASAQGHIIVISHCKIASRLSVLPITELLTFAVLVGFSRIMIIQRLSRRLRMLHGMVAPSHFLSRARQGGRMRRKARRAASMGGTAATAMASTTCARNTSRIWACDMLRLSSRCMDACWLVRR